MSELIDRLKGVRQKVTTLVKQRDGSLQKLQQLTTRQQENEGQLRVLRSRIAELERENEVLRTARSFQGEQQGRPEAKQRIDELVKEIDGCLALLKN